MMRAIILIAAVLLIGGALVPGAGARPDGIGLYADELGARNTIAVAPGETFEIHLLLLEPSEPTGILGWECSIDVPPNIAVLEWRLAGAKHLNVAQAPEFWVGLYEPLPASPAVHLATLVCRAQDGSPGLFYVLPAKKSSLAKAAPCYVPGDLRHVDRIVTLHPASGSAQQPVFGVNVEPGQMPQPLPNHYALHPNTPNPFNPQTVIRYDLPRPQRVSLAIYGVDGRRVVILVDRDQEVGSYEVIWDGRDSGGRPVASGTYICLLQAGTYQQSRRMVLLK